MASTTHYHKSDSDGPCAKRHAGGKPGVEVEGQPLTGDPTAPSLSSQPSVPILGPCQTPRGPGSCSGRSTVPSPPPCASADPAVPSTPRVASALARLPAVFLPRYKVDVPARRGLVPVGDTGDSLRKAVRNS